MGASPTTDGRPVPAAVMSTQAHEVRVEEADDGDASRVFVEGTMYHAGLNKNAWGLTEAGAERIASDLRGRDYTASHPHVRGTKYDRSIAEGQGAPIGTVRDASVVAVEGASVDGGEYTAQYVAEVTDPFFKEKMKAGLYDGEGYGVSIGIYADPEGASCSICSNPMSGDDCDHQRGEAVEADNGEEKIAGPLYDDGDADHLAHVWRPAYEGATADVSTASVDDGGIALYSMESSQHVLTASEVLATPFGPTAEFEDKLPAEASETAADDADDGTVPDEQSAYRVQVSSTTPRRQRDRGSFQVRLDND